MAVQGCPYHDKLPFCHSSLITLDPAPHLPLATTRSIAWPVCTPVTYLNPNTSPKELQLSSLGYFPSLRDELLVILTHPVVTCASRSSIHSYHSRPPSGPITSRLASWLHHLVYVLQSFSLIVPFYFSLMLTVYLLGEVDIIISIPLIFSFAPYLPFVSLTFLWT